MSAPSKTFTLLTRASFTLTADPEVEHEAGLATALVDEPEKILAAMKEAVARLLKADLDDPMVSDLTVTVEGTVLPCDE